jgi:hypothetical protein
MEAKMDMNQQQHSEDPEIPVATVYDPKYENEQMEKAFKDQMEILQRRSFDRQQAQKNLDALSKADLVRLSRSSYLSHINRYNVS